MPEPVARQRLREARERAAAEREAGATTPPLRDKRLAEIQRLREAMVLPVGMAVGWAIDELVAEVERLRYREKMLDRRNAESMQDRRDVEDENDRLMTGLSTARTELERYRGVDAAAKELLARNVEFGTRADNAEARCEDLEDEVKRLREQVPNAGFAWAVWWVDDDGKPYAKQIFGKPEDNARETARNNHVNGRGDARLMQIPIGEWREVPNA